MTEALPLADVLAALSVTTDLAMGQEPEKAIRATVLATDIARHLDLPEGDVGDVFYTTLLKHLGCTATSHEEALLFGPDDLGFRRVAERTDDSSLRESVTLLRTVGRGTGIRRVGLLARAGTSGKATQRIYRAVCEVGTRLAERLDLGESVEQALYQVLERWDGTGTPQKLAGDDISLPMRIAEPATQAVIFHRLGGTDAMLAMAKRRSGGMFDPAVVEALIRVGPAVLERLDREDPWNVALEAEPRPIRAVQHAQLGRVAEAFADMVDLKSPYTLGHSSAVADLATRAAERLGLEDPPTLRLASLLHDLGRTAVGTTVWEKRGPLNTSEWEQVRLHAYHSERILERSDALAPLARIAGMHHERWDGSGYHRGAAAAEVPVEARVLAVADAYQALTQERAHRPARAPSEAADQIIEELRAGRFDPECARAVLDAAGQSSTRVRNAWPARLTDREVEVLRLLCRGQSNKAIAKTLVISPRTAEHHVQHVYAKIGASTRASAAMFAMEHGLIAP